MNSQAIQTPALHWEKKDLIVGKQNECVICKAKQDLDDCNVFNNQTLAGKSKTLAVKKMFYECYYPVEQLAIPGNAIPEKYVNIVTKTSSN